MSSAKNLAKSFSASKSISLAQRRVDFRSNVSFALALSPLGTSPSYSFHRAIIVLQFAKLLFRTESFFFSSIFPLFPFPPAVSLLSFGPEGGRSPVEYRGNLYLRPSVRLSLRLSVRLSLRLSVHPAISPLWPKALQRLAQAGAILGRTDRRMDG